MKPHEFEQLSFQIIDQEAGPHDFSPEEWVVLRRIIHATADFEYMQTICYHFEATARDFEAIGQGNTVYTDTQMDRVGIRKAESAQFGMNAKCWPRAAGCLDRKDAGDDPVE
jgi:precorrin-8X/cobalt-precorrin-8 methylmutase